MPEIEKIDILLKGVPKDVADELERRANENFRSRMGEILAILASVCRGPEAAIAPAEESAGLQTI